MFCWTQGAAGVGASAGYLAERLRLLSLSTPLLYQWLVHLAGTWSTPSPGTRKLTRWRSHPLACTKAARAWLPTAGMAKPMQATCCGASSGRLCRRSRAQSWATAPPRLCPAGHSSLLLGQMGCHRFGVQIWSVSPHDCALQEHSNLLGDCAVPCWCHKWLITRLEVVAGAVKRW